MIEQQTFIIPTKGRGSYEVSHKIGDFVRHSAISTGLCHVFIQHTSASLMICENADPTVRHDVESFFSRLVIDGDDRYHHNYEGDDDMSGHLRSILTHTSLQLPVTTGLLNLGVWQGIYVYEHRYQAHQRKIVVTVND